MTRRGLTIVEVLIALAIVGVATAILSTALVGSIQQTDRAGARTQTTQYLNFLGRKVSGGDAAVLPPSGTPFAWAYGELGVAFADLPSGSGGRDDAVRYRAIVERVSEVAFVGAEAIEYRITVCAQSTTGESCVAGTTLGPEPAPGGAAPLLPGIN